MKVHPECAILLVAIVVAGCGQGTTSAGAKPCADPVIGCRVVLDNSWVTARFSESPRAMRAFVLEVDAAGAAAVKADFSMVGMDMLPNRYDLVSGPDGRWRAQVLLPICVSGRRDWKLALAVDGRTGAMTFSLPR